MGKRKRSVDAQQQVKKRNASEKGSSNLNTNTKTSRSATVQKKSEFPNNILKEILLFTDVDFLTTTAVLVCKQWSRLLQSEAMFWRDVYLHLGRQVPIARAYAYIQLDSQSTSGRERERKTFDKAVEANFWKLAAFWRFNQLERMRVKRSHVEFTDVDEINEMERALSCLKLKVNAEVKLRTTKERIRALMQKLPFFQQQQQQQQSHSNNSNNNNSSSDSEEEDDDDDEESVHFKSLSDEAKLEKLIKSEIECAVFEKLLENTIIHKAAIKDTYYDSGIETTLDIYPVCYSPEDIQLDPPLSSVPAIDPQPDIHQPITITLFHTGDNVHIDVMTAFRLQSSVVSIMHRERSVFLPPLRAIVSRLRLRELAEHCTTEVLKRHTTTTSNNNSSNSSNNNSNSRSNKRTKRTNQNRKNAAHCAGSDAVSLLADRFLFASPATAATLPPISTAAPAPEKLDDAERELLRLFVDYIEVLTETDCIPGLFNKIRFSNPNRDDSANRNESDDDDSDDEFGLATEIHNEFRFNDDSDSDYTDNESSASDASGDEHEQMTEDDEVNGEDDIWTLQPSDYAHARYPRANRNNNRNNNRR